MRQDVRHALRQLARRPGFTGVAVITLAVGIGSTTAIFSVVEAVLLRPLPYPESHRLVRIIERSAGQANEIGYRQSLAHLDARFARSARANPDALACRSLFS